MNGDLHDLKAPGLDLFAGPGEMAALMRQKDWSETPLGHPDAWPRSLRVAVRILLGTGYPMYIAWGSAFTQLYNDAYRPILGTTKHPGALGSGSPETFPEIWEFIGPMFHRVLSQGQETTLIDQALFLDRNGYLEECYYNFSYSPIPDDENGKVGGVFVTCFEVTNRIIEQRRLQTVRDLASGSQHIRAVDEVCESAVAALAGNPHDLPFVAIYLFDQDSEAARLMGCVGASAGDEVCPSVLSAETAPWPVREVLETQRRVRLTGLEERFHAIPTGAWPVPAREAVLVPIAGGARQPAGMLLAGLNPRKEFDQSYEQFLLRCSSTLATRLADARAYADEKRRAESLAELDRAKTLFFSNISHEFRTPLTLILSPLEELAADSSLSTEARGRIELAQRNAIRIQRLVNNLLDFSRIEAGRVEAIFEPADVAMLTADLASGFQSTFAKAGLYLNVECDRINDPVYLDREMWEKIVLNLLSNAFKFTFEGGGTVRVRQDGASVCLTITDTGVGIPAGEVPRIFERFHRVEGSRGRSYEGTGIGLALVQELVKLHGGTISVESHEGRGTRFTITIPTGTAHLNPEVLGRTRQASSTATRVDAFVTEAMRWIPEPAGAGTTMNATAGALQELNVADLGLWDARPHILIAEDNADLRDYLRRLLRDHFEVEAVTNGEEALGAIERRRPDLVLSDVMMPVRDGIALLQAIRGSMETASLPVILLSARAGEEAEIEGLQAGADDYLTKPFSARELIARVTSCLRIAEIRAAADRALRAEEAKAREVLDRTTDAVFMLDRDWRFSFLNRHAVALIAGGGDLRGKNIWEEFPDAIGREFWIQYHRAMNDGAAVEFQEYYPEPLDKWFEVHTWPTEQGIAVFFRDVTARLKSEAALRQSEKLAAAGRLAASISHEINNPLEAVINLLYLIERDDTLSAQSREWLETALSEVARVAQIATQTLRFHRQSTNPAETLVRDVLEVAIALYSRRLQDLRISIERRYRSSRPIVAFAGELRQVFANLLGNALDAIGSDGRILVRERQASDPATAQPGIAITIADTGHGMTRETVQHLFQPFFSTKPNTGTGLGLWVSRDIVLKHGGSIRVRSSHRPERHGTVFRVFLPFDGLGGTSLPAESIATAEASA